MGDAAAQAAAVYLLAYMFTNLGAFAVAIAIEKDDGTGSKIDDFKGLSKSKPVLAAMMAFFMLSLTGFPLTGGFIGKWLIFWSTLNSGLTVLAVIGVLTTIVSAFYYIRVVANMYLSEGDGDPATGATKYVNWVTYIAFAGTLVMGVLPFLVTALSDKVTFLAAIVH
jgi:NADH-quinone oxidoreductase subunit N